MREPKRFPILMALWFLFGSSGAFCASVLRMNLDRLTDISETVVYGRVVGSRCFWDSASRSIWTETDFLVLDRAKGLGSRVVRIVEPGGVLGDVGHFFPGVPKFKLGQELVVFLYKAGGNRFRVTGLEQGVYQVRADSSTGVRITRPVVGQSEQVYEQTGKAAAEARRANAVDLRLDEFLSSVRRRAVTR
jgi:hypothetical protein